MENSLGTRLKQLRKKHNFTQREVGDFLDISQSQLAKVESNERNLKLTKLLKLCDLFNVSEEYDKLCKEYEAGKLSDEQAEGLQQHRKL